ncbi:hypothetical protein IKL64_00100 [bacterium]|nr:hypothetical protein [bacterium]
MQVNMNTNYSNQQNFGMAMKSSDVVNKALRVRIKRPVDSQELSALVEQASKNDLVDIQLFADEKGKLTANVFTRDTSLDNPNSFVRHFSEGIFGGPVKFIRKIVNFADAEAAKINERCDIKELDDTLSKML